MSSPRRDASDRNDVVPTMHVSVQALLDAVAKGLIRLDVRLGVDPTTCLSADQLLQASADGRIAVDVQTMTGARAVLVSEAVADAQRSPQRAAADSLTVLQRQILQHVMAGWTPTEIASLLGLPSTTVYRILNVCRQFYEVATYAAAAAHAQKAGDL